MHLDAIKLAPAHLKQVLHFGSDKGFDLLVLLALPSVGRLVGVLSVANVYFDILTFYRRLMHSLRSLNFFRS